MSLAVGAHLGPYEILSLVGEGGMGEVYKARDTRLGRTVALKILPEHAARNPDRRRRFEQEASAVSALNHPHICVLHDIGSTPAASGAPIDYLVMEYLDGQTLAERLTKGPLKVEQALEYGAQIAEGLAAAHRQGIVHRDLKPANVMITKGGVKLLDFGLARLSEPPPGELGATVSATLSATGTIVGTVPYMAPEQVQGLATDARTDIFALGCVLYEMVTGKRAFEGGTPASVAAAILEHEPQPISQLAPLTPPLLERLVKKCLAKEPDARWQSAGDIAAQLQWLATTSTGSSRDCLAPATRPGPSRAMLVAGVLMAFALGIAVMTFIDRSRTGPPRTRFALDVQPADGVSGGGESAEVSTSGGSRTALAFTPDGGVLVFVGQRGAVRQLYARQVDTDGEAVAIEGTEGAQVPAISADGEWVAFWSGGSIRKVRLGGGLPIDVATRIERPPIGLAWDELGGLFFEQRGVIWQLAAHSGEATAVTKLAEGELRHALPCPLPGGKAIVFTVRKRLWSWGDEQVVVQTLTTGERHPLLSNAADARFVSTGHLVFARSGRLFAVPFDVERLKVGDKETPLLSGVSQAVSSGSGYDVTGAAQFAIARRAGTLAWIASSLVPYERAAIVSVGADGVKPLAVREDAYAWIRLSPDGRRVVTAVSDFSRVGLWVVEVDSGKITPLTLDGEVEGPIWSLDGRRVLFNWLTDGRRYLADQPADNSAPARRILRTNACPSSVTPGGQRVVAASDNNPIAVIEIGANPPTVNTLPGVPSAALSPDVSRDGQWLAYQLDIAGGRTQVYARPLARPGAVEQVSVDGGGSPMWDRDSRRLFFVQPGSRPGYMQLMVSTVPVRSADKFGTPAPVFEFDARSMWITTTPVRCVDISPDGRRLYAIQVTAPAAASPVPYVNVWRNWFEQLSTNVPTR